jgi:hypothetical protein
MTVSNKCFCLGFNVTQGIGFSEYDGYWPLPKLGTGCINIVDSNNIERMLVLDNSDDIFYELSNKQLHVDYDLTKLYKDKTNISGGSGYDITPYVRFKSDTGEYNKFYIEHYSSRFFFKPTLIANIDTTGYDSNGLPTSFSVIATIKSNGNTTVTATDIPLNNEVVFDKKVEGRDLQTNLTFNKSDFLLIGRQQDYIVKDIQYDTENRTIDEVETQLTLSTPLFWMSRGENYNRDLISYCIISGLYSKTWGADGFSDSAISLLQNSQKITFPSINSTATKTFSIWAYKSAPYLTLDDDSLSWYLSGYNTFDNWTLYYTSGITSSGVFCIKPSGSSIFKIEDVRMYESTSIDYLEYLFNDMKENNGNNTLPLN